MRKMHVPKSVYALTVGLLANWGINLKTAPSRENVRVPKLEIRPNRPKLHERWWGQLEVLIPCSLPLSVISGNFANLTNFVVEMKKSCFLFLSFLISLTFMILRFIFLSSSSQLHRAENFFSIENLSKSTHVGIDACYIFASLLWCPTAELRLIFS